MAHSYQTATDLNDILSKFSSFLTTNGWTCTSTSDSSKYEGDTWTGTRLHVNKTFSTLRGNQTVYANMRSANNQKVFEYGNYTAPAHNLTGIACYISSGYNAGNAWDYQPGYYDCEDGSGDSAGGTAQLFKTASINMHMFAHDTWAGMVLEGNAWAIISFGVTDLGVPIQACSGGVLVNYDDFYGSSGPTPIGLCFPWGRSVGNSSPRTHIRSLVGTQWGRSAYTSISSPSPNDVPYHAVMTNNWNKTNEAYPASNLCKYSPDPYKGIPLMVPMEFYGNGFVDSYFRGSLLGSWPEMCTLNMKYIGDGTSITIGSDTWWFFRVIPFLYGNDPVSTETFEGYGIKE